jgi:hypothetical protein
MFFVVFSILFLIYREFVQDGLNKAKTVTESQSYNKSGLTQTRNSEISPVRKPLYADKKASGVKETLVTPSTTPSAVQPNTDSFKSKIIAYYFHGTHRCTTCLTIERYSREAIEKYFSEEIREGILEFKALNVEEPENRHYIQDYQLYTKSLVLALYKDDKQLKWKNLSEVWSYVGDKEKFYQFVKDETERFLQGKE